LIGSGDDNNAMSGVTLPASALAWLASQIIYLRRSRQYHPSNKNNNNQSLNDSLDDDFLDAAYSLDCDHLEQQNLIENALWMGSSMRDRLLLIHFLLPRATHLRIVLEAWPPPKKTTRPTRKSRRLRRDHHGNQQQQQRSSSSPLGDDHDLAFSSMSVQSALTEDDAGPPEPNAASFLQNYYHLEQRPRIEISIFSNLQVLVLDQVAPDCILNLHHARHTLRVLRVERACIYNLHTFLFPKPSSQQPPFASRQQDISNADDPLAAPPSSQEAEEGDDGNMVYWELTHIKLSHCCIGEMSKMRASPTNPHPPLSRCPRLVSLCLSHNQIFKSSTALAGLSSLPWLSKLDLSYNQISRYVVG
jgi:Leucine-rich repeat (LRR) protein